MATKNIVPRTDNEGKLGKSGKRWAQGNFTTASFTYISGSIVPLAANTYDLGTASLFWKDLYISSGSLKFVNPTTSAVIQEIKASSTGIVFQSGSGLVANISGSVISGSKLHIVGDTFIGGDLTLGDAATDSVTFGADINSNLIPNTDDTYDLGSAAQAWQDLFIEGDITLTDAGSVKATAGNLTVDSEAATLVLDGHTGVDIDASNSGKVAIDGAGGIDIGVAADVAIDIESSTLDIDASGAITIDSTSTVAIAGASTSTYGDDTAVWSFNGSGAVSETGMTTFSLTPSSTVDVDAAGAVTIDSSGAAITIGGDAVAQKVSVGADTANRTEVELNAILVDINAGSGGVTIDGGAASNLTTSAGTVTVSGKTGVAIQEDGSDVIAIDTNRDVLFGQTGGSASDPDVEIDGYLKVDGSSTFSAPITASAAISSSGAMELASLTLDTDLAVADGGTGASTFTANGVLIGNGTSAVSAVDLSTDGVIVIGDGSGNPTTLDVGGSGGITILGTIATGVWNGTPITNAYIGDDEINSEHYAAGSIDNEHIADDAINSEHYAADSIDAEHYAAGSVDATAIGNDVVNSQHYAAASIDNEHLADDAVDSAELAAGAVDDAHLSDGVATGLAGAGTTATSGVINVIGGTGITANANEITTTDGDIVHDNLSGFVAD